MAALEALNYINMRYLYNIKNQFHTQKICILIDVDNLPKIGEEITLKELSNNNLDIYMFMNKTNCSVNKRILNEVNIIISPSGRSDSTNVCICCYTGSLLKKNLYDIYFIATNDKFALSLIDMIKSDIDWNNKEAHQITKICQIYEHL